MNIFKGTDPDPKDIKGAPNNLKIIQKNVVKKQNRDARNMAKWPK